MAENEKKASELAQAAVEQSIQELLPETEDNGYLSGIKLWLITMGLMMGVFVMALDNNIIATAIPRITTDFHSLDQVGWYGSAYLLTQMSLQPTFGKIYTYFRVKWIYLSALFIFELGSIIIATAPNSTAFTIGRAIAGVGAAGIFNGGMIIIGYIVPLKVRPQYMAVQSCTYGVASVAGPLLGGVFTDSRVLTWRFCFWISLRALILIAAMVCLLLALQWGGNDYPWSNSRVYGCLIGFGLLLALFIALQTRHADNVTIPMRIITQRTVAASCGFTMTLAMVSSTLSYYLPIFFQAVKGETASGSGIKILPFLMSLTGITLFSGAAITWVGYYVPFMWFGAALALIGSSLLFTLTPSSSTGKLVGYQILAGLGIGSTVQIPFIAAQVVLSGKDMASGMSIIGFFNALGGALAISIAQSIFSNSLYPQLSSIQGIDADVLAHAGATNISSRVPLALLGQVLEAFSVAITRSYVLAIACAAAALACSLVMQFRSVKEQNAGVITNEEESID
ncbi:hypothetical protein B7494_g6895 [Chlorociboria aeruginascens]|nr:hypothetical protein B7494_g6895 [Chlorociboria aeruginascens]